MGRGEDSASGAGSQGWEGHIAMATDSSLGITNSQKCGKLERDLLSASWGSREAGGWAVCREWRGLP